MNVPLNALAMAVAMAASFVFAYFIWTAGSTFFTFPSLVQNALAWVCVGLGFVFLAMLVAAIYDDMVAQESDE